MMTAATSAPAPRVPDWLVHAAALGWRILVVLALGFMVAFGAILLGTVVASVVLGGIVAAAFAPVANRLRASGRSQVATAAGVTLIAVLLGLAVLVAVAVAYIPGLADVVGGIRSGIEEVQRAAETLPLPPQVTSALGDMAGQASSWLTSVAGSIVGSVATWATIILLATFILFFAVMDGERGWAWVVQAAEPRQRAAITDAGTEAAACVGAFERRTAARAAISGLVAFVTLLVLGVPSPAALALFVFLAGFVPVIGGLVSTGVLLLATLASSGLLGAAIVLAAIIGAGIAREPFLDRTMGEGSGSVHPALVLVALPAGATVAGVLGLLVAVPAVIAGRSLAPVVLAALGDEQAPGDGIVPAWLDRIAQWSWRLLVLCAVAVAAIAALVQVPFVLLPVVVAAVMASTFAPLVAGLRRRGWAATPSALAVTAGGFGVIIAILVLTVGVIVGQADAIAGSASSGAGKLDDAIGAGLDVASALTSAIGSGIIAAAVAVGKAAVAFGIGILLGGLLTFFLLRDAGRGWSVATSPFTSWRREELDGAASRSVNVLGGYMLGTGVISAVGAASQFAIMAILGIPLAFPLAVLSFFGGFIPYIGSLLTTLLAFLVTVAVGSTQDIVIMGIFTLVFNIVQGNFVAPLVYGRMVSIHPAIVLLAIPAGAAIAGIAGMFLAVPVIGVVAATWRTMLRVFGDEPPDRRQPAGAGAETTSPGTAPSPGGAEAPSTAPHAPSA
jgi:predicted PurR-regulated permease PerM